LYSITTGLPAFDLVHGQPLFEYLQLHPEAASTFNQAMTGYSELESAAVLAAYDFADTAKLYPSPHDRYPRVYRTDLWVMLFARLFVYAAAKGLGVATALRT
jgi:hypothetical protein